jgi:hypothetical protein
MLLHFWFSNSSFSASCIEPDEDLTVRKAAEVSAEGGLCRGVTPQGWDVQAILVVDCAMTV